MERRLKPHPGQRVVWTGKMAYDLYIRKHPYAIRGHRPDICCEVAIPG